MPKQAYYCRVCRRRLNHADVAAHEQSGRHLLAENEWRASLGSMLQIEAAVARVLPSVCSPIGKSLHNQGAGA